MLITFLFLIIIVIVFSYETESPIKNSNIVIDPQQKIYHQDI